jgi:hypothetical protein
VLMESVNHTFVHFNLQGKDFLVGLFLYLPITHFSNVSCTVVVGDLDVAKGNKLESELNK